MISGLRGKVKQKDGKFVVIGAGSLDFKVAVPLGSVERLPSPGGEIELFTYLHLKEGGVELYGFLEETELQLFEAFLSVSGVGPRSALSILGVAPAAQLAAAIGKGEVELLQRSAGIGRKTAERIILELKDKVTSHEEGEVVGAMEADSDILEALMSLGYRKDKARDAMKKIDPALTTAGERLRDALRKIRG